MRLQNIKKWLSDKEAAHSILDLRKYQKLITHVCYFIIFQGTALCPLFCYLLRLTKKVVGRIFVLRKMTNSR
ncbi:hypothetical protein HanHA89_Chr05g0199141 [Helianthus annuus]|nr:hypothetical protein HanHA89_Chr05g0199141 [Helianthus annuus]